MSDGDRYDRRSDDETVEGRGDSRNQGTYGDDQDQGGDYGEETDAVGHGQPTEEPGYYGDDNARESQSPDYRPGQYDSTYRQGSDEDQGPERSDSRCGQKVDEQSYGNEDGNNLREDQEYGGEDEEDDGGIGLSEDQMGDYWSDFLDESPELGAILGGSVQEITKMFPEFEGVPEEDSYAQLNLKPEAFGGLVGNSSADFISSATNLITGKSGCGGDQSGFGKLDLSSILLSIGKTVMTNTKDPPGGGGKTGGLFGKAFNAVLKHGLSAGGQQKESGGFGGIAGIMKGLTEGKGIGAVIGGLIAGSGGGGNRGPLGDAAGGGNISQSSLNGGLVDDISNFLADGLHKFLGVDPKTGKILGALAGNLIFQLGGKDNVLGNKGKIILDNILSGKSKRKVDPFVSPAAGHKSQDFNALRQECLQNKRLFEDDVFPAANQSLYFSQQPPKPVQWLRPAEICSDPQLFVEGHCRFDVVQGELGDCWLLAAVATLTMRDELFYRVVPPDQSFTENYAGLFHFQFWRYGKWIDVVIDDRLPCSQGKLLYMHSSHNNEFWSALLEKAYAKLYGSYEALKGGNTCEALEDFTGGITEYIDLKDPPANLIQMMFKAFECGSLLGCSIEADTKVFEARLPNGLVRGHAYSITGIKMINTNNGQVPLLRIRNPWGNQQEWNGAWSDHAPEWNNVAQDQREDIGLTFGHDGEFWMSFDDFSKNFEKLELCHLGPDVMNDIEEMTGSKPQNMQWKMQMFDGQWIAGQSAGGCRNFIKTFTDNPQFGINLTDPEPGDKDGMSVAIMAVLQKDRRERRNEGLDMLPIGFAIYEAESASSRLTTQDVSNRNSCARSPIFINLREIVGRFRFKPGSYIMVPSTFEPDKEAAFMVRVYSYPSLNATALN